MSAPVPEIDLGALGIAFNRHGAFREIVQTRQRGRYVQIRILNTQGRLRLRGLQVEGRTGGRSNRDKP